MTLIDVFEVTIVFCGVWIIVSEIMRRLSRR